MNTYLTVGAALLVLTAVTIMVAQVDLGSWNVVVALGIACLKASLVVLIFMHLRWANQLYAIIPDLALVFLSVFIMFDTRYRAEINEITDGPLNPWAVIYDAEGKPIPMEAGRGGK